MSDAEAPRPPFSHPGPPPPLPPVERTAPTRQPARPPAQPTAGFPPYVAPYAVPRHPQYSAAVNAYRPGPAGRTPGVVALALAVVALLVTPAVAATAAFAVGVGTGGAITTGAAPAEWDWGVLSPVRDQVLLGEIAFWAGLLLGVGAIAQGIVAIVSRRGRAFGIAAIVVAVVTPAVFAFAAWVAFGVGVAAGYTVAG